MSNLTRYNTPVEQYDVEGIIINVKREDLSAVQPAPPFSKVRGLAMYLDNLGKITGEVPYGIVATDVSMRGWALAALVAERKQKCFVFYPQRVNENKVPDYCLNAMSLGAELVPIPAGRYGVMLGRARVWLERYHGIVLPNTPQMPEMVEATSKEAANYVPDAYMKGTWVVPTSSGATLAGVIKGLHAAGADPFIIAYLTVDTSPQHMMERLKKLSGVKFSKVKYIQSTHPYTQAVNNEWIPFPCNEYYDAKAFEWLCRNVRRLKQPVLFWNVGA